MTYLIEYLSEFEYIFETIRDYESGEKWVLLMQENRRRKSHAWAPLIPKMHETTPVLIIAAPYSG